MKKFAFSFVLMMFLFVVGFASNVSAAELRCGEPENSTADITYAHGYCGNGSPENVMNVWGTKNSQLPHIKQGESYIMSNGVKDTCPWWYPMYCVDVSVTQYWKDRWGK